MKETKETVLEEYPIEKITKFVFNKTLEGESIIEGIIVDKSSASVILRGVLDSGKGKPLKENMFMEGKIIVSLDKNNYDEMVRANYEFVQSYQIKGIPVENLYRFLGQTEDDRYLVEL